MVSLTIELREINWERQQDCLCISTKSLNQREFYLRRIEGVE